MSDDELRARFPNASDAFIRANLAIDSAWKDAIVESSAGIEPLAAGEVQKEDRPRFLVRVVSVRRRLLDEDNLCAKFHVDLCRYAGAIPCDSPERCHIETTQRRAKKGEAECTEITIEPL